MIIVSRFDPHKGQFRDFRDFLKVLNAREQVTTTPPPSARRGFLFILNILFIFNFKHFRLHLQKMLSNPTPKSGAVELFGQISFYITRQFCVYFFARQTLPKQIKSFCEEDVSSFFIYI